MSDNDKRQPDDEEAYLLKYEQDELKRERSTQKIGCWIVLLVIGVLALIVLFRVFGR